MSNQLPIDSSKSSFQTGLVAARSKVVELEQVILDGVKSGEFVDGSQSIELVHHFIPKGYAREMRVKAGVLLTGRIHRRACFNVVLSGELTVINGTDRELIIAPAFFVSPAGSKRAMLIHKDSVWITVHPVNDMTVGVPGLEAELTCDSFEELNKE